MWEFGKPGEYFQTKKSAPNQSGRFCYLLIKPQSMVMTAFTVDVAADRSHAPRGNAAWDAPRPQCVQVTQSVTGCITTRSVGTIDVGVRGAR
ncbi:hypothetical protein PFLU3_28850 [Pseudomonas fluorescens]|uniref:Uncharacterized protein n=1 Tax=Pseudomonas fluorescens TaxID=294 RepID=A0A0D0TLC3_PSEFL|nr:Urea carboxylase [Pseudomonas synxantha]KIR21690.1 hypothetical protein PFLU3_28850 [Pseudomonas fluorescens]